MRWRVKELSCVELLTPATSERLRESEQHEASMGAELRLGVRFHCGRSRRMVEKHQRVALGELDGRKSASPDPGLSGDDPGRESSRAIRARERIVFFWPGVGGEAPSL